jgi:hypothetical protein
MTLSAQLHAYRRTARRWSRPLPGEAPGRDGAHRLRAGPPSRHSPTSSQDGCPRLQTWERRTHRGAGRWFGMAPRRAQLDDAPPDDPRDPALPGRAGAASGALGWPAASAPLGRDRASWPARRGKRPSGWRVCSPLAVFGASCSSPMFIRSGRSGAARTANPSREEPLGPPRPRLPNVARRLLRRRSVARPLTGRAPRRPGTHAGASGRDRGVCRAESPAGRGADPRNSHAHGYFLSRYLLDERIVDINALRRRSPTASPPAPPAVSLQPGTPGAPREP